MPILDQWGIEIKATQAISEIARLSKAFEVYDKDTRKLALSQQLLGKTLEVLQKELEKSAAAWLHQQKISKSLQLSIERTAKSQAKLATGFATSSGIFAAGQRLMESSLERTTQSLIKQSAAWVRYRGLTETLQTSIASMARSQAKLATGSATAAGIFAAGQRLMGSSLESTTQALVRQSAAWARHHALTATLRATQSNANEVFQRGQAIMSQWAGANSNAAKSTAAVAKSTAEAQAHSQAFLLTWHSIGRLVAVQLLHRAVSALSRAMAEGIQKSIELQIRISELRVISRDSQLTTGRWAEELRGLSEAFGVPILTEAEGAYQTLSNQIAKGAKVTGFLAEANKLAIATVSTTAESVKALSAVMNAYGDRAGSANTIAAQLNKTVELGRLRLEDISDTIGTVTPLSAQLGISFAEVAGAIDTLTLRGLPVSTALTQMRGLFIKLIQPSTAMKKLYADLGVETGEAAIKTFGLSKFLKLLSERTQGSSTELSKYISRIRGLLGALVLVGEGHEAFLLNTAKTEQAIASYNEVAVIGMESTGRQLKIAAEKIKNIFVIDVGYPILDTIKEIGEAFGGWDVLIKALIQTVKFVLIPALGGLVLVLTAVAVLNPWIGAIAGAAVLTTTIAVLVEKHKQAQQQMIDDVRAAYDAQNELSKKSHDRQTQLALNAFNERQRVRAVELAQATSSFNNLADNFKSVIKALNDETSKVTQDALKRINEQLKESTSNISTLESIIKKAETSIDDIKLKREEFKLDVKIANLQKGDFATQLVSLHDFALKLFKKGMSITDPKQLTTYQKTIAVVNKVLKEGLKVQQSRAGITEKIAKMEVASGEVAVEVDKVERKLQKAKKSSNKENAQALLIERDNLIAKRKIIDDSIAIERAKLKGLESLRLDFETSILDVQVANVDHLKKLQLAALQEIEQERLKIERKKALEADQKQALGQFAKLDVPALLKLKGVAELEEASKKVLSVSSAVYDTTKALYELGEVTPATEKVIIDWHQRVEDFRKSFELAIDSAKLREGQVAETDRVEEVIAMYNALSLEFDEVDARIRKLSQAMTEPFKVFEAELAEFVAKASQRAAPSDISLARSIESRVAEKRAEFARENAIDRPSKFTEEFLKLTERRANIQASLDNLSAFAYGMVKTTAAVVETQPAIDATAVAFDTVAAAIGRATTAFEGAAVRLNTLGILPSAPVAKAAGGPIYGTDTVPALLSPGEFVMNAKASRQFYGQLMAMNTGVKRFAEGGPVTNVNGDFNISVKASGNETVDVQRIGNLLRREIRRGTLSLV